MGRYFLEDKYESCLKEPVGTKEERIARRKMIQLTYDMDPRNWAITSGLTSMLGVQFDDSIAQNKRDRELLDVSLDTFGRETVMRPGEVLSRTPKIAKDTIALRAQGMVVREQGYAYLEKSKAIRKVGWAMGGAAGIAEASAAGVFGAYLTERSSVDLASHFALSHYELQRIEQSNRFYATSAAIHSIAYDQQFSPQYFNRNQMRANISVNRGEFHIPKELDYSLLYSLDYRRMQVSAEMEYFKAKTKTAYGNWFSQIPSNTLKRLKAPLG